MLRRYNRLLVATYVLADFLAAVMSFVLGYLIRFNSGAIEVPQTRDVLRRVLAGLGYPYLVLRLGLADPDVAGPPHTPRMPAAQILDTSAVRLAGS